MVYGKISKLKLQVPYTSLSSKPVTAILDGVDIVVQPITNQAEWDLKNLVEVTDLTSIELAINNYVINKYEELKKTKEELQEDAKMNVTYAEMIADNIKVVIQNVHIRVENCEEFADTAIALGQQKATLDKFSLGITLDSVQVITVDGDDNEIEFLDRRTKENKDKAMLKKLKLHQFGIYQNSSEDNFVMKQPTDQMGTWIKENFSLGADGKIPSLKDNYLLQPIELGVYMKHFTPAQAIKELHSEWLFQVSLDKFEIILQKIQYDQLQLFLELSADFKRQLTTKTIKQKNENIRMLSEGLYQVDGKPIDGKVSLDTECLEKFHKKFQEVMLDAYIEKWDGKANVDFEKVLEHQRQAMAKNGEIEEYRFLYPLILKAVDQEFLKKWNNQVAEKCKNKQQEIAFLKDKEKEKNKKKGGMFSFMTADVKLTAAEQEQARAEFDEMQKRMQENIQAVEEVDPEVLKMIPQYELEFEMKLFKVSLVMNLGDSNGIILQTNDIKVQTKMYDAKNFYNENLLEMGLQIKDMSVLMALMQQEPVQIVRHDNMANNHKNLLDANIKVGNKTHHATKFLPPEKINKNNLTLVLGIAPIDVRFYTESIKIASGFFQQTGLKDATKILAQSQFEESQKYASETFSTLATDFVQNSFKVDIYSPTLFIPFEQNENIGSTDAECWIFNIKHLKLYNNHAEKGVDFRLQAAFNLLVQDVRFLHSQTLNAWYDMKNEIVDNEVVQSVIRNFSMSLNVLKKRPAQKMTTPELRQGMLALKDQPNLLIDAQFVQEDVDVVLKPENFFKLLKIGEIFSSGFEDSQAVEVQNRQKLLEKAFYSDIGKFKDMRSTYSNTRGFRDGDVGIIGLSELYFFPQDLSSSLESFSLRGCNSAEKVIVEKNNVYLANRYKEQSVIQLTSEWEAKKMQSKIITAVKKYEVAEQGLSEEGGIAILETRDTFFDNFQEEKEEDKPAEEEFEIEKQEGVPEMVFVFQAPTLRITLQTDQVLEDAEDHKMLTIITEIQGFKVDVTMLNENTFIKLNLKNILIKDNRNDERFPSIFSTRDSQDLVDISVTVYSEKSDEFQTVEKDIKVVLGNINFTSKPKIFFQLRDFLKQMVSNDEAQKNEIKQSQTLKHTEGRHSEIPGSLGAQSKGEMEIVERKVSNAIKVHLAVTVTSFNIHLTHPENSSYPIFTALLSKTTTKVDVRESRTELKFSISNLQVFDNTKFPETLDPTQIYPAGAELPSFEIFGLNITESKKKFLKIAMTISQDDDQIGFGDQDLNPMIKLTLNQIKIVFVQTQVMRLLDYAMKLSSMASSSPSPQILEEKEEISLEVEKPKEFSQAKQGIGLDLTIESPLIIAPIGLNNLDKFYFTADMGTITVQSSLETDNTRWPENKEDFLVMCFFVGSTRANISFVDLQNGNTTDLLQAENLQVIVQMPQDSPLFKDKNSPIYKKLAQEIDLSIKVNLSTDFIRLFVNPNLLENSVNVMIENILKKDQWHDHFTKAMAVKSLPLPQEVEAVAISKEVSADPLVITFATESVRAEIGNNKKQVIGFVGIVKFDYKLNINRDGSQHHDVSNKSLEAQLFTDRVISKMGLIGANKADMLHLQAAINDNSIKMVMDKGKIDLNIKMSSLLVKTNLGDERYPNILNSVKSSDQSELAHIDIFIDKGLTQVAVNFAKIVVHFKPVVIAQMLSFLNEFIPTIMKALDFDKLEKASEPKAVEEVKEEKAEQISEDKLEIDVKLNAVEMICMHPVNDTYPLFTVLLSSLIQKTSIANGITELGVSIQNFQLFDNTRFPNTLDPELVYSPRDEQLMNEIMGLNGEGEKMLTINITIKDKKILKEGELNPIVDLTLKQTKIVFFQTLVLRDVAYLTRVLQLFDSGETSIVEKKKEILALPEDIDSPDFDLGQSHTTVGLDLKIESPLLIIPTGLKNIEEARFVADMGKISIQSRVSKAGKRWVKDLQKISLDMDILISSQKANITYWHRDTGVQELFSTSQMGLKVSMPQDCPLLKLKGELEGHFDRSMSVHISTKIVEFPLNLELVENLLDTLTDNILKKDWCSHKFEPNFLLKTEEKMEKKPAEAQKSQSDPMKLTFTSDNMILKIHDHEKLISEINLVQTQVVLDMLSDGGMKVDIEFGNLLLLTETSQEIAQQFYSPSMLGNQKHRTMMIGSTLNRADLLLDDDHQKILVAQVKKIRPKPSRIMVDMKSNGDMSVDLSFNQLKVYIRPAPLIPLVAFTFDTLSSMDTKFAKLQTQEEKEKKPELNVQPPEMKIRLELNDSLIILEGPRSIPKCLACEISVAVSMTSKALPADIESAKKPYQLSLMEVNVKKMKPFFCIAEKFDQMDVQKIPKREIIQNINCNIRMVSEVTTKGEQHDTTKLALGDMFMMVSVKDLKVIKKTMDHEMDDINKLFKTMEEHSKPNSQQQVVVKQVKFPTITEMQIKVPKLQIFILDEKSEGGLVPIFWVSLQDGWYENIQRAPKITGQSKAFAKINFKSFNHSIEEWEPLFEDFSVHYTEKTQGKVTVSDINLGDHGLAINFSPEVARNIASAQSITLEEEVSGLSAREEQRLSSTMRERLSTRTNRASIDERPMLMNNYFVEQKANNDEEIELDIVSPYAILNLTDRPFKVVTVRDKPEEKFEDQFEPPEVKSGYMELTVVKAELTRDTEVFGKMDPYVVVGYQGDSTKSPVIDNGGKKPVWNYKTKLHIYNRSVDSLQIKVFDEEVFANETIGSTEIAIEYISDAGGHDDWHELFYKGKSAGKVHLKSDWVSDKPVPKVTMKKLGDDAQLVSSMKFASFNMDFQHDLLDSKKEGNPMDLNVQILLDSELLSPQVINLNSRVNQVHWIYNSKTAKRSNRECYFIHNETIDNKRVLVVRTQYAIVNKTGFPVQAMLSLNKKSYLDARLEDGDQFPLMDHDDVVVNQSLEVSLKMPDFENNFQLKDLKQVSDPQPLINSSFTWFGCLRWTFPYKKFKEIVNIEILPPVILENYLPFDIEFMSNFEKGQQRTQSLDQQGIAILNGLDMSRNHVEVTLFCDKQQYFTEKPLVLNMITEKNRARETTVVFRDKNHKTFRINCRIDAKESGVRAVFYASQCFLQYTTQDLTCFDSKMNESFCRIGAFNGSGEKHNVMMGDEKDTIRMALMQKDQKKPIVSKDLSIKTAGTVREFEVPFKNQLLEYVYQVHLNQVTLVEPDLFCKVISIQPAFVVVNKTKQNLFLAQGYLQNADPNQMLSLKSGQRLPLYWNDKQKPKEVKLGLRLEEMNSWSGTFTIVETGTIFLQNKSQDGSVQLFKVSKREVSATMFLFVYDIANVNAPCVIRNQSDWLFVDYFQDKLSPIRPQSVIPRQEEIFVWPCLSIPLKLNFTFSTKQSPYGVEVEEGKKQKIMDFHTSTISNIAKNQVIKIVEKSNKGAKPIQIYYSISIQGATKIVEFHDQPQDIEQEEFEMIDNVKELEQNLSKEETKHRQMNKYFSELSDKEKPSTFMTFSTSRLDLSLCTSNGKEMISISYNQIEAEYNVICEREMQYQLSVNRVQFDNTYSLKPVFPVILQPKCMLSGKKESHDQAAHAEVAENMPWFFFCAKYRIDYEEIIHCTVFNFLMQEVEMNLEWRHVISMLNLVTEISGKMGFAVVDLHPVFYNDKEGSSELMKDNWTKFDVDEQLQKFIYIENFAGTPVAIRFSLMSAADEEIEKSDTLGNQLAFMSSFGLKFLTISDSDIALPAVCYTNYFGPQDDIRTAVMTGYISEMKSNALRLVASSDLLGNPRRYRRTTDEGWKQMAMQPKEGFEKGFIQGVGGVVTGGNAVFKSYISGFTGSIGSFANSAGAIVGNLTFDDDYEAQRRRDEVLEKPTGAIDGVAKGGKAFGKSLLGGITGIVTKPMEGAKKGGISGFFKGAGKGLVGVVAKPVAGVAQLAGSTAKGLSAATNNEVICPIKSNQMRPPRAFYGKDKEIKLYNEQDGQAYMCFRLLKKQEKEQNQGQRQYFVKAFHYKPIEAVGGERQKVMGKNDILVLNSWKIFSFNSNVKVADQVKSVLAPGVLVKVERESSMRNVLALTFESAGQRVPYFFHMKTKVLMDEAVANFQYTFDQIQYEKQKF